MSAHGDNDTSCFGSDRQNDDASVRSDFDEVKAVERLGLEQYMQCLIFCTLVVDKYVEPFGS